MPLTLLNWLLALSPLIVLLGLMLGFNWGGGRAGAAAWLAAVLVAMLFFRAGPVLLAYAQAKAILYALDVLLIVWTALLLYHVTEQAGAVETLGAWLPRLTADPAMQSLLLSWLFISFLQGIGGFGVPVAVVAPLLVGLGFSPVQAVVMASLGHGWAVTFGSQGASFAALIGVTGLGELALAPEAAIVLGAAAFVCGFLVIGAGPGWPSALRSLPLLAVLALVMGGAQYYLVTHGLWNLGATGGALAGLIVGVGITRLGRRSAAPPADPPQRSVPLALIGYVLLVIIALSISLISPLKAAFNSVRLTLAFPEISTGLGWITSAEQGRAISVFGHPGSILFYTACLTYLIYQRAGYYAPGALQRIGAAVFKGGVTSALGIIATVSFAVVMTHAGMTNLIARGLSEGISAGVYPLMTPFIGALGAFMTGSNTNSNVVFGPLQQEAARLLGLSVTLMLAGQTAGGALGSVLAPAKLIVGCSTVGLSGQEGPVIRRMAVLGLIPVACVALLVWLMARF